VSITSERSTSCILAPTFVLQLLELAVFDVGRDVVVGVEAAVGTDQAVADAFGDAHQGELFGGLEDGVRGFGQHGASFSGRVGAASVTQPAARRLDTVNTPSLPLARLLNHTADAVQAVRAGHSLNARLARCPAEARPGTPVAELPGAAPLGQRRSRPRVAGPQGPAAVGRRAAADRLALLWPSDEPPYPEHTLVDQAVTASQSRPKANAPFVNAVLRRFLRERASIVETALRDPVAMWNHPRWWIERLRHDWPERWQAILAANNRHPPMTLRVNTRRGSVEAYIERLAEAGIPATVVGPQAIDLVTPCPVNQLPGFHEGDVSVQDAAAQIAAPLLLEAVRPEPTPVRPEVSKARPHILDACAAPGGKTAHLLELADLDILAIDSDATRLQRMHGHPATPAPARRNPGRRRRTPRRLVEWPPLRRHPARRPLHRLGHRAPPPRRALAAPRRRRAGPRRHPGAPARRPVAHPGARRQPAVRDLLGLQGRRPAADRRFFATPAACDC
jgi:hypothetical protein